MPIGLHLAFVAPTTLGRDPRPERGARGRQLDSVRATLRSGDGCRLDNHRAVFVSTLRCGAAIDGISSFYDEINRVFMKGEDWTLGPSLDALDDMLHGGYGALAGHRRATVVWREFERCRGRLGVGATREYLQEKLAHPHMFDVERFGRELAALERGSGQTYFDIVLEIFDAHPSIVLLRA